MSDESCPLPSGATMLDGLGEQHGLAASEGGSRLLVAAVEGASAAGDLVELGREAGTSAITRRALQAARSDAFQRQAEESS